MIAGPAVVAAADTLTPNEASVCGPDAGAPCLFVLRNTDSALAARAADWVVSKPLKIALVLLVAFVLYRLMAKGIYRLISGLGSHRVRRTLDTLSESTPGALVSAAPLNDRALQRAETVGAVLRSVAKGAVGLVALLMILGEFGINLGPLIAGAGIIGIALGFGAQSLVKDFLSGIFLLIEDQFGVGDVIDVGEASGLVEGVSLRTTRLRDVEGTVWYVPNGEIRRVGNKSQQWSRALLDVLVAYETDLDTAIGTIKEVADGVWHDETFGSSVLEEPEVWGVEGFGPTGIAIRLVVKTRPADQWKIMRELRQRLKSALDAAGVQFGFEKTPWLSGAGDPGPAPPAP
ncbi:MAG: mechanosensitive ion channel family protein [Actinomycetota bacterium]|nr:mechanosensitive ion channel family protein [Actinomycetota bacterium]